MESWRMRRIGSGQASIRRIRQTRRLSAVAGAVMLSLAFGSRSVTMDEISQGIVAWLQGKDATDIGAIAVQRRIPRTVLALMAGAALAISGALMQAITRGSNDVGRVHVQVQCGSRTVHGFAAHTDTTRASIEAFLDALRILNVTERKEKEA